MEMNSQEETNSTQVLLSYELLCLLQWLATHKTDKIKKMISKALVNGLDHELQKKDTISKFNLTEDIQDGIVDFFTMLESLLLEASEEHAVNKALENNLMPAIGQIDSSICDDATVRSSIEGATSQMQKTNGNPKELLLKELLKRWKPTDKNKNILN